MKAFFKKLQALLNLDEEMLSGTAWMILSYGIKLSLLLISFVLLARTLGPESFGVYMAILSFAILLNPFFDLGAYSLVIRDITRHNNTARAVGDSLVVSLLVLPVGLIVLLIGHAVLFDDQTVMAVMQIGISQFLAGRALSLGLGVNIANATISRNAILEIINGSIRMIIVGTLFAIDGGLEEWLHLQLLGSTVFASLVFLWIKRSYGFSFSGIAAIPERMRAGAHFAIASTARNVNTELDKVMIYEYATVAATGIYSAATRFAVMSVIPINALLSTVTRHFFIQGESGYKHARLYAQKLIPATASYGLFAAFCLWFFADFVVVLLGDGYEESADALRYLALYPLIQSILLPYADALTGAGLQKSRSTGTIVAMVLNLVLNFSLIPIYGWQGAVIATLISQSVFMLYVVFYARRYL